MILCNQFDVTADPSEYNNFLAGANPDPAHLAIRDLLLKKLRSHNATTFTPDRGTIDLEGVCAAVEGKYGGFWGPWVD